MFPLIKTLSFSCLVLNFVRNRRRLRRRARRYRVGFFGVFVRACFVARASVCNTTDQILAGCLSEPE